MPPSIGSSGVSLTSKSPSTWLISPSCDEASAALIRHVRPRPLCNDEKAIPESDQKEDVDGQPREPGDEAAQLHESEIGHRRRPPDRRQRPLVAMAEWRA